MPVSPNRESVSRTKFKATLLHLEVGVPRPLSKRSDMPSSILGEVCNSRNKSQVDLREAFYASYPIAAAIRRVKDF